MTMTVTEAIRAALEGHLVALTGGLPTAYQNVQFQPVDGVPYQRCAVLRANPESPTMGRKLTKEHGVFQVTLLYPEGQGTADIEAQADRVKEHFKPPMTIIESGLSVLITDAIQVATGFPLDGRFAIPVSIPWMTYVAG